MPGFQNIKEWVDSCEDGMCDAYQFRKMSGAVTIAGQWVDYTYASGRPISNFYATAPLVGALIGDNKGIDVGGDVSPYKKYIRRITTMMMAAGATTVSCQNVQLLLCDYLLAYPFVDMDDDAEQEMIVGASLPNRYGSSVGVQMMLVAQGQTVGGGTFQITYTNSDGTPGRVTPVHFCAADQPAGALVQAYGAATGISPYVTLQAGDVGVQSVQKVQFTLVNGGICAVVLYKPLMGHLQIEECRRTTSGTLASFGSPSETSAITDTSVLVEIKPGAVLGFIGRTMAGSVASSQLIGMIETIWR